MYGTKQIRLFNSIERSEIKYAFWITGSKSYIRGLSGKHPVLQYEKRSHLWHGSSNFKENKK